MRGSAKPSPDPSHRPCGEWPGMFQQQLDDPRPVVAVNGQTVDPVTAFDLTFCHGVRH